MLYSQLCHPQGYEQEWHSWGAGALTQALLPQLGHLRPAEAMGREMKAETGSVQPSSWTDNSQQLQCRLPQCCLQTCVTIPLMLIHGTPEVSAQPPAGFSLAVFVPPEAVLWLSVWPCFSACLQTDI